MLLQTNSYIVPKDKRSEHARLLRKFRQTLLRLGCDHFEVYEQVGANWSGSEATGRFVQIMRFRDRKHQQEVQAAEKQDPLAQQLIAEFCALINFPYQQQQGLFAVGFYRSALPVATRRKTPPGPQETGEEAAAVTSGAGATATAPLTEQTASAGDPAPAVPEAAEGASLLDFGALASASEAASTPDHDPEALALLDLESSAEPFPTESGSATHSPDDQEQVAAGPEDPGLISDVTADVALEGHDSPDGDRDDSGALAALTFDDPDPAPAGDRARGEHVERDSRVP